jgi:hypothetical protein
MQQQQQQQQQQQRETHINVLSACALVADQPSVLSW